MLSVFIDGEQVYEFGMSDERSFGRTPGSVINFIDIPYELEEVLSVQSPSVVVVDISEIPTFKYGEGAGQHPVKHLFISRKEDINHLLFLPLRI